MVYLRFVWAIKILFETFTYGQKNDYIGIQLCS